MKTLGAHVKRKAETTPDALFCRFIAAGEMQQISFGQLYRNSCCYARAFERRGVAKGSIVLIVLQHSPHLFYSFVGAVLAGAVPSFMPFPTPKQRSDLYWRDLERLFARIEPALIVTYASNGAAARAVLPDLAVELLYADDDLLTEEPDESTAYAGLSAAEHDTACLQHSSGTTGLKRGVVLTHAAIFKAVESYSSTIGLSATDVIASWLPLYHDMGFVACFLTGLITGAPVVALDPFEWVMRPAMLFETIEAYRATFCWLPNFAFGHLVKTVKRDAVYELSSVRAFINCSEPCKLETMERFVQRFAGSGVRLGQMQVCYAMAENVFAVTQTPIGREPVVLRVDADAFGRGEVVAAGAGMAKTLVSCGTPIPWVDVQVRTVCEIAAEGVIGEIHLSSAFRFDGYYKQPAITAERLRDGWFATGDLGFFAGAALYVVGRVDDMIAVNGRNYYAHEIEEVVSGVDGAIPGRNVAIAIDEADTMQVIVLVECYDGSDRSSLAATIRRCIADRMGLTVYSVVVVAPASLAKTTSGKISRVENKKMYLDQSIVYAK